MRCASSKLGNKGGKLLLCVQERIELVGVWLSPEDNTICSKKNYTKTEETGRSVFKKGGMEENWRRRRDQWLNEMKEFQFRFFFGPDFCAPFCSSFVHRKNLSIYPPLTIFHILTLLLLFWFDLLLDRELKPRHLCLWLSLKTKVPPVTTSFSLTSFLIHTYNFGGYRNVVFRHNWWYSHNKEWGYKTDQGWIEHGD